VFEIHDNEFIFICDNNSVFSSELMEACKAVSTIVLMYFVLNKL
jgi:hypothetical protein